MLLAVRVCATRTYDAFSPCSLAIITKAPVSSSRMVPNPEGDLVELPIFAFGSADLLVMIVDGPRILAELLTAGSPAEVAQEFVGAHKRRGLLKSAFLKLLSTQRSQRVVETQALAARWPPEPSTVYRSIGDVDTRPRPGDPS